MTLLGSGADAVLRFAWTSPAFSTNDAIDATGLTRSTVIAQCEALSTAGWLQSLPDTREAGLGYRAGRPARRFALQRLHRCVVGVDAGEHAVTAIAADLTGAELARVRTMLSSDDARPARRLARIEEAILEVLAALPARHGGIGAIAVGIPAPVGAEGAVHRGRNPFWDAVDPGIREHLLAADLGPGRPRVLVDNDANLAALAETRIGAAQALGSSATLLAGERFGAGLVVDGALLRGRFGGAGELDAFDLGFGVGSATGLAALAREWAADAAAEGRIPPASALAGIDGSDVDAQMVFLAADDGDPYARRIVDSLAERLARICALLHGLLGLDGIVVAGAIAPALDPLLGRAREHLEHLVIAPAPVLAASPLGAGVVGQGAVLRAIEEVRDRALEPEE